MDTPTTEPTLGRDRSLGDMLRDARQAKGLELSDIAEITHVRKEYLKALEADDYSALPEDIYTKNFVKLFAQTVGLQEARALDLYARARGRAPVQQSTAAGPVSSPVGASEQSERVQPIRGARPPLRIGAWLPIALFIGIIVALALWGAPNFLRSTRIAPAETAPAASNEATQEQTEAETPSNTATEVTPLPTETPDEPAGANVEGAASEDGLFALTVTSDPPGAEVTIDGFVLPGTTPLTYRLSPGTSRTLRLNLEGYEPYDEAVDLNSDLERTIALTPLGQETVSATEDAPETAAESPEPGAETESGTETTAPAGERLTVTITEPTWLEAYGSTQRGVGERLVYTTAQPGQSFTFELPVFLHVGNAGGVTTAREGEAAATMGSSGEVISRAYTP